MRRVQKKIDCCTWEATELQNLCKGELFRMYEPCGEAVATKSGVTEFIAASEPYLVRPAGKDEEPCWGIEIVENPGF